MEGTNYTFDQRDRVALKDIPPEFYGGWACTGNQAIVKDRRKDKNGLPEIYVEWDKNHWAYNGAKDGWTFQEHFELIEKAVMGHEDDKDKETQRKIDSFLKSPTEEPNYDESIDRVAEVLRSCESFVVVAVKREEHPEASEGILIPVVVENAKNQEAELVAQLATSQVAAQAHAELTIAAIQASAKKR